MDNKTFLEQNKNKFNSLNFFDIQNNYLILKAKTNYILPLQYTNLVNLPTNLFLLHPVDIYKIIYIFEFLNKKEINDKEQKFIEDYTNKYLELSKDETNKDDLTIWGLGLPIHFAYDSLFINNPASNIIRTYIEKNQLDKENDRGNNQKLVLIKGENTNFDLVEEYDNIKSFKDAGFTTIFLITSAIVSTCLYIAYFIIWQ